MVQAGGYTGKNCIADFLRCSAIFIIVAYFIAGAIFQLIFFLFRLTGYAYQSIYFTAESRAPKHGVIKTTVVIYRLNSVAQIICIKINGGLALVVYFGCEAACCILILRTSARSYRSEEPFGDIALKFKVDYFIYLVVWNKVVGVVVAIVIYLYLRKNNHRQVIN